MSGADRTSGRPGWWWRAGAHALVYAAAATMLAPLVWMVLTALKTDAEIASGSGLLPREWRWENFRRAWESASLGTFYFNSLTAATANTVFGVLHCALAGYAFAKLRFRGRRVLFWTVLATMMLPIQVYFIIAYLVSDRLGYVDTVQGLYVPFLASGFGIFYMRQAISSVPDSLLEAGRIDGMTEFELFWNVVGPTIRPAVSALGIFTFVFSWNNFFWPLILIDSRETTTLPVAVSQLITNQYGQSWAVVMAALTIITLPLILVFLVFQRAFVEGVAITGMKE